MRQTLNGDSTGSDPSSIDSLHLALQGIDISLSGGDTTGQSIVLALGSKVISGMTFQRSSIASDGSLQLAISTDLQNLTGISNSSLID